MIPYILYSGLVLFASFVFYKLLLQKETFFHLNRFVLLACMVLAFMLPLLPVPQQWSFREVEAPVKVSLQKTLLNHVPEITPIVKGNTSSPSIEASTTAAPVSSDQIMQWIVYIYWLGVIIFSVNFILQVFVLLYKAYTSPVIKDGQYRIVEMSDNKAPCSFLNNVFINPVLYDELTYKQILLHEKIHITQKHTIDLLFAEIVLIFQWFNPFAWLWRKELENNLEYLTDDQLLQHDSIEKTSYQMSLLKVAVPNFPLNLTTNYNQSRLKKRFIMMNAKKSNMHTMWKYLSLLGVMILFVCLFNDPIAQSQTKEKDKTATSKNGVEHHDIKTSGNWFATIKDDKINIQFRDDNDFDHNSYNGNTFLLSEFKDLPRDKTGTFTLTREAGTMEFTGKFDGNTGMGQYKFTADKTYTSDMQKQGIDLSDDNGEMVFFFINVKRSYVQMLKDNGYTKLDKDDVIPLAALDINADYIKSIKESGLPNVSLEDLIPFRSLGIDKAYIEEIRKAGYPNVSADKLITFKAQGIDGKYISDFRSSDKTGNSTNNTNNNNNNHNNAVANNNNNKDDDNDEDAMVSYKALGITGEYVQSLNAAGLGDISNDDIISMKSLGVTADYIKSFVNAGFKNVGADDIISMKAQGITPSSISEYKALGVGDISLEDVVSAKATGTTPQLISEYKALGFKDMSLDDIVAAKSTGTTPELIKEYRSLGFQNLDLDDVISAKSTGTTPAVIKQYRALGFENLKLDDIISAVATGTTPEFITSMRQKGHNMTTLEKYVSLKAVLE